MSPASWFLIGFSAAAFIAILVIVALIYVYRVRLIAHRVGAFELALRTTESETWTSGIGIYGARYLEWHRTVSLSLRPKYRFQRSELRVTRVRPRQDSDVVEATISDGQTRAQVALRQSSLNALVSWADSAPPRADLMLT